MVRCVVMVCIVLSVCGACVCVQELELMESRKKKAEIQALSNKGFQYLTQVYLPKKIAAQDWI